jgi:MscS family membrane protein
MLMKSRRLTAFVLCLLTFAGAAGAQGVVPNPVPVTPATDTQTTDATTNSQSVDTATEPLVQTQAAPDSSLDPDPRYATPEATMFEFLAAMERYRESNSTEDLDAALACLDLSGIPPETRRQQARRLLYVLDRVALVEAWHFATFSEQAIAAGRYVYFPQRRIQDHASIAPLVPGSMIAFTMDQEGHWKVSSTTIADLPEMNRSLANMPRRVDGEDVSVPVDMLIRSRVPPALTEGTLLGIEYWQWLALAAIVFVGFLVDLIVRGVARSAWSRIAARRREDTDKELLKRAVRPFGLIAAAVVWYLLLSQIGLPTVALKILLIAARVVMMLAGVWTGYRVVDLVGDFLARQADRTDTKLDDLLIPLARKTVKVIITVFGLIYIAESFDVQILPLLTGLGIGGLAFAFAAKDTIENFFGSIAVILDHPFEVGDWVVIDDVEGTVEMLGLRSTRIRTFYNSLVTVPNASLVRATVDNYGRRQYRRFTCKVGLTYDTPPDRIEAFCEGCREIVRQHPYTRKDSYHVYLNSFGASSLDVLVYIFFVCPDWSVELRERQRFMLDVIRLGNRLGVSFAFPTQTIELKRVSSDEKDDSPLPPPPSDAELAAQRAGMDAARTIMSEAAWRVTKPGGVVFRGGMDTDSGHEARGSAGDAGEG